MYQEAPLLTLPGPWGIPIQIQGSLLFLLILFLGLSSSGGNPLYGVMLFGVILVSILLHELGHAWACVVQRIPVKRIVLHGGGGFCQHDAKVTPYQSEFIVIMGPIVNLTIWATATLALPYFGNTVEVFSQGGREFRVPTDPGIVFDLLSLAATINLFLAIFNMIPIFPLDGGQLLNAVMRRWISPVRAMKISGAIGLVMGVLWIPLMFAAFYTLGFILLFFPSIRAHWQMFKGATPS